MTASRLPNPTAKKKKLVCRIASQPRQGRKEGKKEGGGGRFCFSLSSPPLSLSLSLSLSSYPGCVSISMTVAHSFAYIYHFVH